MNESNTLKTITMYKLGALTKYFERARVDYDCLLSDDVLSDLRDMFVEYSKECCNQLVELPWDPSANGMSPDADLIDYDEDEDMLFELANDIFRQAAKELEDFYCKCREYFHEFRAKDMYKMLDIKHNERSLYGIDRYFVYNHSVNNAKDGDIVKKMRPDDLETATPISYNYNDGALYRACDYKVSVSDKKVTLTAVKEYQTADELDDITHLMP